MYGENTLFNRLLFVFHALESWPRYLEDSYQVIPWDLFNDRSYACVAVTLRTVRSLCHKINMSISQHDKKALLLKIKRISSLNKKADK